MSFFSYFGVGGLAFICLLDVSLGPFIFALIFLNDIFNNSFDYGYMYIFVLLYVFLKYVVRIFYFLKISKQRYRYRCFLPFCYQYYFGKFLESNINSPKILYTKSFSLFMQIFLTMLNVILNVIFYCLFLFRGHLNFYVGYITKYNIIGFVGFLFLFEGIYLVFLFIFNLYYGRSLIYFLKYICKVKNKFLLFFVFIAKILNLEIVPLLVCHIFFSLKQKSTAVLK